MTDGLTQFILKPGGPLAAGVVLFGVVWGFFKGVESVLNDDTKLEVAVWLLGVKVGVKVEPWPDTFAKVFDRVFGEKHLSWKCFRRSCIATTVAIALMTFLYSLMGDKTLFLRSRTGRIVWPGVGWSIYFTILCIPMNYCSDYGSLLETRLMIHFMKKREGPLVRFAILMLDILLTTTTFCIGFVTAQQVAGVWNIGIGDTLRSEAMSGEYLRLVFLHLHIWGVLKWLFLFRAYPSVFLYASLLTSIWLWLYAGAGFLLKTARHFDLGFDWFNRHFDIEKKPLQSIGLVAGALVALIYWTALIVTRVIG